MMFAVLKVHITHSINSQLYEQNITNMYFVCCVKKLHTWTIVLLFRIRRKLVQSCHDNAIYQHDEHTHTQCLRKIPIQPKKKSIIRRKLENYYDLFCVCIREIIDTKAPKKAVNWNECSYYSVPRQKLIIVDYIFDGK